MIYIFYLHEKNIKYTLLFLQVIIRRVYPCSNLRNFEEEQRAPVASATFRRALLLPTSHPF